MEGSNFIYALLAGLVPSLVWLFFWTREDESQPEPRSLLAGCFFGGMLVVLLAIPLEQWLTTLSGSSADFKYTLWAAAEEMLKFLAVAVIALKAKSYDEPVDAVIYTIAVALGFAAMENTLFIMGPMSTGQLEASIITGNMRFIGATLVHVVSSAMIGFALGYTFYRGRLAKYLAWVIGLILAVTIHASFNITIAGASVIGTLKAFGWVWGAVVIMIVLFEEVKAVRPPHDPDQDLETNIPKSPLLPSLDKNGYN